MSNERKALAEDQIRIVRDGLDRVLGSSSFEGKDRLREFLQHVVVETLNGRANSIRAKNIAVDVYQRDLDVGDPENMVRAHARRARQFLGEYYRTAGEKDPVRICLEPGSYVPTFDFRDGAAWSTKSDTQSAIEWDWRQLAYAALAGFALCAGIVVLVGDVLFQTGPDLPVKSRSAEREAVFSKSATALQAINLAEQARGLIFPVFDPDRQRLTSQLFLRVIDLDPQNFMGYAGASQSLASLAMLLPVGDERALTLEQAKALAEQAIAIAPSEAWTQSAIGWTALAHGNYEEALEASRRAFRINPEDEHVLDFYAGVALFAGEFEEAATVADPAQVRFADSLRHARRNIYGAASFHLGRYNQTLKSLREAAALGDPVSFASVAYQAAALHALDRKVEGRRLAQRLSQDWPLADFASVIRAYFRDRAHADDVIDRLIDLGWSLP